jgi:DNA-binding NtrC family response regulator
LPYNILLVDDDKLILETYKTILELEGYNVHTAPNPYKAIQIIKNQYIQLAILDYNLPNMTGTQLGRLIKKAQKSTEVMFISGTAEIHEIAKTVNYDVCKVFSKPIDLELLIQTIKSTLGETGVTSMPSVEKSVEKQAPNLVSRLIENIVQTLPITIIQPTT